MLLFFTGAHIMLGGRTLKTLEDGHRILMERALTQTTLPAAIDPELIILGNHRADLPALRPDGRIGLWGIFCALVIAQTLPKYAHGMRQPWHHPTHNLYQVQNALYQRLEQAIITPNPDLAAEYLGGALHTLQDTYTIGHTERENNADLFSPLVRLHFSPSRIHPFISPNDRVWADEMQTALTPEAQTAVVATVAALELFSMAWCTENFRPSLMNFVQTYTPIRGQSFVPPV